jgi:cyclic dehypoxanthinyl futalosine synthase
VLRTLALARLVLDNFDNLQASWVTQGGKVGQLSLAQAPMTWAA